MGLCSDLNDVSSDSIPLLLVALAAHCVSYLRSLLICFLQSMGLSRFDQGEDQEGLFGAVGSGLARLIVLTEQLNVNRAFSYKDDGAESDCVVCLCRLADGEQVRRLDCCHVFHRECLDGWFDQLNLNCPLCRSPLVSEERVLAAERRVGGDLVAWFSPAAAAFR